jgi:hypothetical protein
MLDKCDIAPTATPRSLALDTAIAAYTHLHRCLNPSVAIRSGMSRCTTFADTPESTINSFETRTS